MYAQKLDRHNRRGRGDNSKHLPIFWTVSEFDTLTDRPTLAAPDPASPTIELMKIKRGDP
jgi:hypothetical protein